MGISNKRHEISPSLLVHFTIAYNNNNNNNNNNNTNNINNGRVKHENLVLSNELTVVIQLLSNELIKVELPQ